MTLRSNGFKDGDARPGVDNTLKLEATRLEQRSMLVARALTAFGENRTLEEGAPNVLGWPIPDVRYCIKRAPD